MQISGVRQRRGVRAHTEPAHTHTQPAQHALEHIPAFLLHLSNALPRGHQTLGLKVYKALCCEVNTLQELHASRLNSASDAVTSQRQAPRNARRNQFILIMDIHKHTALA